LERATGIEPVLPTWESKFSIFYFQHLQNCSEKMYVHAMHTVYALPDLRVAGGRLGDGVSQNRMLLVATVAEADAGGLASIKALKRRFGALSPSKCCWFSGHDAETS
jgi:hypothetical protein